MLPLLYLSCIQSGCVTFQGSKRFVSFRGRPQDVSLCLRSRPSTRVTSLIANASSSDRLCLPDLHLFVCHFELQSNTGLRDRSGNSLRGRAVWHAAYQVMILNSWLRNSGVIYEEYFPDIEQISFIYSSFKYYRTS